jgi:hypothetical protein
MLAGGLMIGTKKNTRITDDRDYTRLKNVQTKVDEIRKDYNTAARQPEKHAGYRRGLLGLVRRAIARSAYFRTNRSEGHADTDQSKT